MARGWAILFLLTVFVPTQSPWAATTAYRGANIARRAGYPNSAVFSRVVVDASSVLTPSQELAGTIDYKAEYYGVLGAYRNSLDDARQMCMATQEVVGITIVQLDRLLGLGVGTIVSGGATAAAGGVNIYLTGKTAKEKASLAELQTLFNAAEEKLNELLSRGFEIVREEEERLRNIEIQNCIGEWDNIEQQSNGI